MVKFHSEYKIFSKMEIIIEFIYYICNGNMLQKVWKARI